MCADKIQELFAADSAARAVAPPPGLSLPHLLPRGAGAPQADVSAADLSNTSPKKVDVPTFADFNPDSALERAAAAFGGYEALAKVAAAQAASVAATVAPPPGLAASESSLGAWQLQMSLALSMQNAVSVQNAIVMQAVAAQAMAVQAMATKAPPTGSPKTTPPPGAATSRLAPRKGRESRGAMAASKPSGTKPKAQQHSGVCQGTVPDATPMAAQRSRGADVPDLVAAACDADRHAEVLQLLDTPAKATRTVKQLQGSVIRLSFDRFGCRVVQKCFDVAPSILQVHLAEELKGRIMDCAEHMHGNFVLQKCIEQLPQNALGFIVEEMQCHAEYATSHMYGCRAVQRLLEHCSPNQVQVFVGRILRSVCRLARDTYGNNVLRHLLEHGGISEKRHIISAMSSNIVDHAKNKSSSLVLERCLQVSAQGEHACHLERERAALIRAILGSEGKRSVLQLIMLDKFGNYIVQRVIECSRGEERLMVQKQLYALEPQLRSSTTGKHILSSMRRQFGQGFIIGGA